MSDSRPRASAEDFELVERLRSGDEATFMALVERHQPAMLRIARMYVSTQAVAEEVVQDAWLGVLRGLDGFEGRSSLRTWIFRILVHISKTRGRRESRSTPCWWLGPPEEEAGAGLEPSRFLPADDPTLPGHWAAPPASWEGAPEAPLMSRETLARIRT